MSNTPTVRADELEAAYRRGRRSGLATAAFAIAIIAYLNLLGIEKSVLAIVLAAMALKGSLLPAIARVRTWGALALAAIHTVTVVVIVIVFADKLGLLAHYVIELYHSLG